MQPINAWSDGKRGNDTLTLFTRQHKTASKLVYQGRIFNLQVDDVSCANQHVTREMIQHNGGVVIACQPEPDLIVLVKQYRYVLDRDLIELPAGRLEINEEPLAAAKRELREETGYQDGIWRELSKMYPAPGFCDELLHLYHAAGVSLTEKMLDHDEETEVIVMPVAQAWQDILSGKICDAKTIAGLAMIGLK